jgi:hypothetical protein
MIEGYEKSACSMCTTKILETNRFPSSPRPGTLLFCCCWKVWMPALCLFFRNWVFYRFCKEHLIFFFSCKDSVFLRFVLRCNIKPTGYFRQAKGRWRTIQRKKTAQQIACNPFQGGYSLHKIWHCPFHWRFCENPLDGTKEYTLIFAINKAFNQDFD